MRHANEMHIGGANRSHIATTAAKPVVIVNLLEHYKMAHTHTHTHRLIAHSA